LCSIFENNHEVFWCYHGLLERFEFKENWKGKIEIWKKKLKESSTQEFKLDQDIDEVFESWFSSLFARHVSLLAIKRLWGVIFTSEDDHFIVSIAKAFLFFLTPKISTSPSNEITIILANQLKDLDIENVITKAMEYKNF
jgi:hypothetical protein